jgi:hypothetical protein
MVGDVLYSTKVLGFVFCKSQKALEECMRANVLS